MNNIGKRIKELRKEAGLTQEKLAEELSVTVGYVSQIEGGRVKINLEMLGKIAFVAENRSEHHAYEKRGESHVYSEYLKLYHRERNR
mgnify:CR=1 FL=1